MTANSTAANRITHYVVVLLSQESGCYEYSRMFSNIRAARKWKTFCQKFSSHVRIMEGGVGTFEVF